jgi:hypothetical protein
MAQSIQLIEATVKYSAGKVFTTQYGAHINAVLTTAEGEKIKLWGNPTMIRMM